MNRDIHKQRVQADFSDAASNYDAAAVVQHEICDRTLERVDMLNLAPQTILDIGTGTGRSLKGLCSRFPESVIVASDLALAMLQQCKRQIEKSNFERYICCDAEFLPFADASFDLIFSTSTFQWCVDLNQLFLECRRVLSPNGVLIFSSFGPDTLKQLRESWMQVDDQAHVHNFIDMHHIGDKLLATQFLDPVVDMEIIDVQYQSVQQLLQDLKDTGSRAKFSGTASFRPKGLMSKHKYQQLQRAYESYRQENDLLPASYEVIYGYARNNEPQQSLNKNEEFRVSISEIKK